ncbi:TetR/AcrR family transcriptional regulator [Streptoalloteichus hindustanus]|uniref:Transcriptional regulator, TetR family n=1 Tax=Streptoalloteichus hindustanus TaxID=2017 RepID=A0A1M5DEF9_STRHI|nr:TetR family transcriptional regulator [Streptoalloteichus hindustanus]SHF65224.1 transcriptional regulator, TetR family [Streptoalloteichus hindustanus]
MPREIDHAARREALCDAVVEIACREGFPAVTIRAVAAAMTASTTTVTHYFRSRDELVSAAVRRELDRFQGFVAADVGDRRGADALLALVEAAVVRAPARTRNLWLSVIEGARRDPVLAGELAVFNRFWDERIARHSAELTRGRRRRAAIADTVDVVTSGLVSLSFEDAEWDEDRRRALIAGLLRPLLRTPAGTGAGG